MRKVTTIQNTKSICVTVNLKTGYSSLQGLASPRGPPIQALNLKRILEPIKNIPHTVAVVLMFLEGHDSAPADRVLFTDGRIDTALERTCLYAA